MLERGIDLRTLGNIVWIFFGGFENALCWFFAGCLWSITIVGIPIGFQCFKFANYLLWPFKKDIIYHGTTTDGVVNLLWILFSGIWLAMAEFVTGCMLCFTIIGIPFGLQHFKFIKLALMPFGSEVVQRYV